MKDEAGRSGQTADTSGPVWYTYFLRCEDGSLYVGITTDPARRFAEHAGGRAGARYTKLRKPVRMEAAYVSGSRAEATRLEYRFKKMTHAQKEAAAAAAPVRDTAVLGRPAERSEA